MNVYFRQNLKINGAYLEDLVPGYQTLEVTGRDTMEMDIETITISSVDGERFRSKRKVARTITVRFCVTGYGPEDFAARFAKLKAALKVTEAQLIFDDEPDKYWIGTPAKMETEQKGPSAAVGTIEIACHDPHKYGLTEREVPFVDGAAEIYYAGTEEQAPVFHVENQAANGFVSFSMGDKSLIFGDTEDDGTPPTDPDSMVEYIANRDGIPTAGTTWTYNDGTLPHLTAGVSTIGTLGRTTWTPTNQRLYPSDFGTDNSAWHGPSMTYHLAGSKTDWSLVVYHRQEATANDQRGMFQIALTSASGSVASARFVKSTTGSMDAGVDIFINGTKKKTVGYSMSSGNAVSGSGAGVTTISKQGSTITVNLSGASYQFTDPDLETVAVTSFTIFFGKWKDTTALNTSYAVGFRFTAPDGSVETHTFWAGDTLDVDCGEASVRLNEISTPGLGTVTNPWEAFKLVPGRNVITMDASEWTSADPTGVVRYREVFT